MNGWRPDIGPPLEAAMAELRTAELSIAGRLPWSSNLTFLVVLEPDDERDGERDDERDDERVGAPLNAVYKPASGEQSLWDFPDGLYRREVAAYALSEALGWGLVPPTVVRDDGPFGPGSLQLFVEADYEQHYFTLLEEGGHDEVLRTMCAFDVVANNADRKSGHVLQGACDRLWAIDHGLCFHRQTKLRTVIWDFVGEEVPDRVLSDLERLAANPPDELAELLSDEELAALAERTAGLLESGVFPEPISDRPYPWPMV